MDAKEIRGWLLCQPRPVKLRVTSDNKSSVLPIDPSASWAKVAESVAALDPELIEALDAKDDIIRAVRPEDEDEEEEEEDETEGDMLVPTDGESARFIIVAKLLGDAYKHSTSVAFDKLGELFQAVVNREQAQARTLEAMQKMMMKQALEAAAEGEAPEGSFESMMMQSVLQGMAKKQAEDAAAAVKTNGVTNGAPKGDA